MEDEGNAYAYTSGNMIILNESCIERYGIKELIAHELFHCITRHSPEFRQKMYNLIIPMNQSLQFTQFSYLCQQKCSL
jgi:hypothetical protein